MCGLYIVEVSMQFKINFSLSSTG